MEFGGYFFGLFFPLVLVSLLSLSLIESSC